LPFRPASVTVHPLVQAKFDNVEKLATTAKQPAQAIWKGVRTAASRIEADGQWGEVIPPNSIPKVYRQTYGLRNHFCVDLPAFHRLFYTIRDRDIIVIDLVDHDEYDRLMKV
jgi:hypothetical protein